MSISKNVKNRYKIKKKEIDIFLPDLQLGIEFDGSYFHKDKEDKDQKKYQALLKLGIKLIRVREPLKKINELDLVVDQNDLTKKNLNDLMNLIKCHGNQSIADKIETYLSHPDFVNEELFKTYLSYFPSPLPEHSLEKQFPNLLKEWHPQKNIPLTPKNFTAFSNQKVWWRCPKGHEYDMIIKNRTSQGINCPFCRKRVDESIRFQPCIQTWQNN